MRDNVTITDESYVGPRGGFGVEDYLVPKRPITTADIWFEPYPDSARLSLSGGLSNPSGNQQSEQKADTGLKAEDVDLSRVQPQRRRRSFGVQALARGIDLFDMISGVDKDAYLGKTLANEIEYEKKLAEEDPEGYQADVNRAKLLSQRAYETDDIELKKKYGAAIKKLLPAETAGLDDLTASAYYTGNEKMEIEKLKAASRLAQEKMKGEYGLQKQGLANEGKTDVQELKNASAEQIAEMKTQAQRDIAAENNAYRMAIAEGRYDNALQLQEMRNDSAREVAELNNATRLEQEGMRQEGQTERTNIQQGGANYRANLNADTQLRKTEMQQEGAMERVKAQQEGALERARIMQAGALERAKVSAAAKGKGDTPEKLSAFEMKVAPDALKEMKALNDSAGRWDTNAYDPSDPNQGYWSRFNVTMMRGVDYGVAKAKNTKEAQDYQKFEGLAKQIVQDQLKKIYGSQFTEREGERFFMSMGLSPISDKKVRWQLFMNAINDLRVKNGYNAIDPETFEETPGMAPIQQTNATSAPQTTQSQPTNVTKQNGRRVF